MAVALSSTGNISQLGRIACHIYSDTTITLYEIMCLSLDFTEDLDVPTWLISVAPLTTSHEIRLLKKFTGHSIRVRAVNSIGGGPFSGPVEVWTLEDGMGMKGGGGGQDGNDCLSVASLLTTKPRSH